MTNLHYHKHNVCKLQKPEDKPLEWTLPSGGTNVNNVGVAFATSGILTFSGTSFWDGIAVYKPVLPQFTTSIYKEFELVTLGTAVGNGALGTTLNVTVGLVTKTAYEAAGDDNNWAKTTMITNASSGGSFVVTFQLAGTPASNNGFSVTQETVVTQSFTFVAKGANDENVAKWYEPGLRLQMGILYGAGGTSKLELVFVYNGVIRSRGSVELGSATDGLTDTLNGTQEDMYFFIGSGAGGTPKQEWRLPKKTLYKYFGTIYGNTVPYNVI